MTLTDADIQRFMEGGCNAAEVAAYGGFSELYAYAWMRKVRLLTAKCKGPQDLHILSTGLCVGDKAGQA